MRLFDKKFRENKGKYIGQSLLAGFAVAVALMFFDVVRQPVIIASFGASAFIAFTVPQMEYSNPRHLIGGYIIGIIVGVLVHYLANVYDEHYMLDTIMTIFAGAIAVGLAMFLMTITDTEHAPATSIALGLVVNQWTPATFVLILLAIVIISVVQRILKPRMMDLI